MRTLKLSLMAFFGLLILCGPLSASAAPELDTSVSLVRIIFVVAAAVFLAGCVWRLSHCDPGRDPPAD